MKTSLTVRACVAQILCQVMEQGQSLSTLLPARLPALEDKDRALAQELCYGVLRTLPELDWIAAKLIARPLSGKQRCLHYLILSGLYQLAWTRIPHHAILSETVNAAVALQRPAFKGLINGVLRQFQRQQAALQNAARQQPCQHWHPQWLLARLQQAYPDHWQKIVQANNQRPPMWLRVNPLQTSRDHWLQRWQQQGGQAQGHSDLPQALQLATPTAVAALPGFAEGQISVQDLNAQRAAPLLSPRNSEAILDLCAAPGGKTTHLLELAPGAQVLALDLDDKRLARVRENLQRLNLQAKVQAADGRFPAQWGDERLFDRILLDAPCSATGVIRRHPDIKWLRRDEDIAPLVRLQAALLQAAWSRLKPGGSLLYATCSLLPEENQQQIAHFLASTPNARQPAPPQQWLPGEEQGDGFFYALLTKTD